MAYKNILAATVGLLTLGAHAFPTFPFGDHSVIKYCNDRYPLDCHFERVHEDKCIKLSHPGDVHWIAAIMDNCWLYRNDDCSGDHKWSLDVFPFIFDTPFDANAVYCS